MGAVDGGLTVQAKHLVTLDVVDLLLPGLLELFKDCLHRSIAGLDVCRPLLVEKEVGIVGILHKDNRYVRMGITQDPEELLLPLVDKLMAAVGDVVEHEDCGILDLGHQFSYFIIQQGVAAEAKVHDLPVQDTGKDVRKSHAGTVGAASLKDA